MSRLARSRRPLSGLGALSPNSKQVLLGLGIGAVASTIIYFSFFFAPSQTKGKAGTDDPAEGGD